MEKKEENLVENITKMYYFNGKKKQILSIGGIKTFLLKILCCEKSKNMIMFRFL